MKAQVLVADDSVTIQKVVGLTLSRSGVELIQARSGEEALRKAREIKPDLMLIDHSMGDRTGQQLCAEIRQDPRLKDVPIILMAAALEPLDEAAARGAGASDVVTKPFESQALIDKVKQLLASPIAPAAAPQPAMIEEEQVGVGAEMSPGETPFVLETPEELGEEIKLPADVMGEPQLEAVAPEEESVPTYDLSTTETEDLPLTEAISGDVPTHEVASLEIEDVAASAEIETYAAPAAPQVREAPAVPAGGAQALVGSPEMVETLAREVAERVAAHIVQELRNDLLERVDRLLWEVVPDLAEQLLTQEIQRIRDLVEGQQ
ncbi:MAG: PleD family two-component system response regulator [Candidatus Methylomirabilales bacterium]